MLMRRLVINALLAVARNPAVQRKAGDIAGKAADKALDKARPKLLDASRRAGELTRKAQDKINKITNSD
ncbi:MAG: hypothetical protein GWP36_00180 [Bacteroidetes bacterium]|jgi:hypothetical protein|nr:hypothetical protein [Bacteroidota bacterium]